MRSASFQDYKENFGSEIFSKIVQEMTFVQLKKWF